MSSEQKIERSIHVHESSADQTQAVADFIAKTSADAIKKHGKFVVAFSGGSLPKIVAQGLLDKDHKDKVDWSKWFVYFADERLVPLEDPDSNYASCKRLIFDHVPIPENQIFPIDPSVNVDEAAKRYAAKLQKTDSDTPRFDLLLLGMGPDGHTCSLFPNHKLLQEKDLFVAPISDSPKPPPQRITLTLKVVNAADAAAFVVAGASKQEALNKVLGFKPSKAGEVPSKLVASKQVYFFLGPELSQGVKINADL